MAYFEHSITKRVSRHIADSRLAIVAQAELNDVVGREYDVWNAGLLEQ